MISDYKIIVAGSREFADLPYMIKVLDSHINDIKRRGHKPIIVSGTAGGADRMGEQYAHISGLEVIRMPADWNALGKRAGYARNVEMAKVANEVHVFWDGKSSGSKHMIDIGNGMGLLTFVHRYTDARVYVVQGDLLTSDCTVIAHQANCLKTMGAGFAKQLRAKYPEAYQADLDYSYLDEERLGKCSRAFVDNKQRVVINLYGQLGYSRNFQSTNYDAVRSSLRAAFTGLRVLEERGFPVKFGLPYGMGAGLGGGSFDIVLNIITNLAEEFGRDVYLYKLP